MFSKLMSLVIPLGREVDSSVPAIYDSNDGHINTSTYLKKKLAPAVTYWQVEYKFTHLLFRPTQVSTFTQNHTLSLV